jgi:hypothetical protein
MVAYFSRLNECDRRLYCAVEALKLPYGGISYIASLMEISRDCIYKGISELEALQEAVDDGDDDNDNLLLPPKDRIRRPGAGRPRAKERDPGLNQAFCDIVAEHTAGDPMDGEKKWTDLSPSEISELLSEAGHPEVGEHVVKGLLKDNKFRPLSLRKELITGWVDPCDRNAQFENIAALRQEFIEKGNPVIGVDTKKKELLGLLYRKGKLSTQEGQRVYDHDYTHLATGKVVPQAIYDWDDLLFERSPSSCAESRISKPQIPEKDGYKLVTYAFSFLFFSIYRGLISLRSGVQVPLLLL